MERFPRAQTGWRWRSGQPVDVGVACIEVGHRARIWVDYTRPDSVAAFEAEDLTGLSALTDLFGKAWADLLLDKYGPSAATDDAELAPPPLEPPWRRLAAVLAVSQWSPMELDEADIIIDEACAWAACGRSRYAAEELLTVQNTVVEHLEAFMAGDRGDAALAPLRTAADLLRNHPETSEELRDMLAAEILPPHALAPPWGGAIPGRTGGGPASMPSTGDALVDTLRTWPRVIAFDGTRFDVTCHGNGPAVVVSAQLCDLCPPTSKEATTLVADVIDAETGVVFASGALNEVTPDGRVTAHVLLTDEPQSGFYALVRSTGLDGDGLHSDRLRVERATRFLSVLASERLARQGTISPDDFTATKLANRSPFGDDDPRLADLTPFPDPVKDPLIAELAAGARQMPPTSEPLMLITEQDIDLLIVELTAVLTPTVRAVGADDLGQDSVIADLKVDDPSFFRALRGVPPKPRDRWPTVSLTWTPQERGTLVATMVQPNLSREITSVTLALEIYTVEYQIPLSWDVTEGQPVTLIGRLTGIPAPEPGRVRVRLVVRGGQNR